jgi:hypothetical protein
MTRKTKMNSFLSVVVGIGLGWWLGPALSDIAAKVIQEIKDRRYR